MTSFKFVVDGINKNKPSLTVGLVTTESPFMDMQ